MRASAVRTSTSGQPCGRARRQLDPSRPQLSRPRRLEEAHEISTMVLENGILVLVHVSALDELPRRRPVRGPTSGLRSTFKSGRFVRRAARAAEGRPYQILAYSHISS